MDQTEKLDCGTASINRVLEGHDRADGRGRVAEPRLVRFAHTYGGVYNNKKLAWVLLFWSWQQLGKCSARLGARDKYKRLNELHAETSNCLPRLAASRGDKYFKGLARLDEIRLNNADWRFM